MASSEFRDQIGGTAPTNPETMAFIAIETRSPYRSDCEGPDAGKNVWLVFRSLNNKG